MLSFDGRTLGLPEYRGQNRSRVRQEMMQFVSRHHHVTKEILAEVVRTEVPAEETVASPVKTPFAYDTSGKMIPNAWRWIDSILSDCWVVSECAIPVRHTTAVQMWMSECLQVNPDTFKDCKEVRFGQAFHILSTGGPDIKSADIIVPSSLNVGTYSMSFPSIDVYTRKSARLEEIVIASVLSTLMDIKLRFDRSSAAWLAASWIGLSCKLALHTSRILVSSTYLTVSQNGLLVISVHKETSRPQ